MKRETKERVSVVLQALGGAVVLYLLTVMVFSL